MWRDPARKPGALEAFVKSYGMTVAEASDVIIPLGFDKGRLMRHANFKSLFWWANRRTKATDSVEFQRAVCAARILRAAHFNRVRVTRAILDRKRRAEEMKAKGLAGKTPVDEEAGAD